MTTAKAGVCDVELVTAAANGDLRAWDVFADRVMPEVWDVVVEAKLDDAGAQDVCNLIFLRLAQRLHEFVHTEEAIVWARRSAAAECRRTWALRCATPPRRPRRLRSVPSTVARLLPEDSCIAATCD